MIDLNGLIGYHTSWLNKQRLRPWLHCIPRYLNPLEPCNALKQFKTICILLYRHLKLYIYFKRFIIFNKKWYNLPDMLINELLLIFVRPKIFNLFSTDGPNDLTMEVTPSSVTQWHLLISTFLSSLQVSAIEETPKTYKKATRNIMLVGYNFFIFWYW